MSNRNVVWNRRRKSCNRTSKGRMIISEKSSISWKITMLRRRHRSTSWGSSALSLYSQRELKWIFSWLNPAKVNHKRHQSRKERNYRKARQQLAAHSAKATRTSSLPWTSIVRWRWCSQKTISKQSPRRTRKRSRMLRKTVSSYQTMPATKTYKTCSLLRHCFRTRSKQPNSLTASLMNSSAQRHLMTAKSWSWRRPASRWRCTVRQWTSRRST